MDLTEGKADAAMVSETMDIAVAAAEAAGKKVDPASLKFHEVKKNEIVFVVHPGNSVTNLTWEQFRDIQTGKITNWKQVGGKDLAITVYSAAVTGGTRAMVKKVVMGGEECAEPQVPDRGGPRRRDGYERALVPIAPVKHRAEHFGRTRGRSRHRSRRPRSGSSGARGAACDVRVVPRHHDHDESRPPVPAAAAG